LLYALIAAAVGAVFMGLASVPPVALVNTCCGVLYVSAGFLSAWVWVRLSGGKSSVFWCFTSGALAGVLFAAASMGTSAVSLWLGAEAFAAKLNESAFIRDFPDEEVRAHVQNDPKYSEEQRLEELARVEDLRRQLAAARQDPERSREVDKWMSWITSALRAAKRGDTSPLMIPVVLIMGLVGVILAAFSSVGGLIGGLLLGDDTPEPVAGEDMVRA